MNPNYENIEPLVNYIKANHIKTPLKLEIGLDKVSSDGMTRYFTIKINGDDVTGMVAKALDNKISKAKDTPFKNDSTWMWYGYGFCCSVSII